jgi:TetR/AcrR family transcriptional regulator, transcriptional repressor for nem operon
MGRKRKLAPDAALDRALGRFWSHGYGGTSVADLVDASTLNRGSLYGTFGDKDALFHACLDRYAVHAAGAWLEALERPGAGLAEIRRFFKSLAAYAAGDLARRGCLMVNTAVELAPHEPKVEAATAQHFRRMETAFRSVLERSAAGLRPGADPASLAPYLVAVASGLLVLARAGIDRAAAERIVEAALSGLTA